MSQKKKQTDEVVETAAETTAETTAEAVQEAVEETAEPAAEAAAETEAMSAAEDSAEEEAVEEVVEPSARRFRIVSNIVKRIKEKTGKPEVQITVETDPEIEGDLDEIILDDDIIAELQEYERREKMKKKAAICAAGALAVGILIGVAIKSRKK